MLILLIGPKGSGKSPIGRLLASKLGVTFFNLEPHWMSYYAECKAADRPVSIAEGMRRVHPHISLVFPLDGVEEATFVEQFFLDPEES